MSGKITALTRQKRRRKRINVFLDGEYVFSVNELLAAELHLGQELSDQDIDELRRKDEANQAQERALRLLEHRPRSRSELSRRLRQAHLSQEAVETALDNLERVGLVDDEAFARFWVEQRLEFRPRSRRALRHELRRHGVPDSVVEDVLRGVSDEEAAAKIVERRLARTRSQQPEQWEKQRQRLFSHMQRLGFDYYTIKEALASFPQELDETKGSGDSSNSE